jgi:peptidoglycan/LPS O-acetylase OafA/YrhL
MNTSRVFPFRYELLDGLRGIAALAVVASHLGIVDVGREAVMVFFVISGYCIAASAESCRRRGTSLGGFMVRRLHRIYPPYLFAILFYALTRWVKMATGGVNDLDRPWLDWVQNLTMTQWFSLVLHPAPEAVQNPKLLVAAFWSLNYEDQFYLVMGLALVLALRRGTPIARVVIALAVAGVAWNCLWPGGWVTGFFLEYWIDFAVGAALFHVLCLYPTRTARFAFVGATLGLLVWGLTRIIPWGPDTLLHERAWTEITVAAGFALVLYFLRGISVDICRLSVWKPVAALGVISYSLYLVHQFNLFLVATVVGRLVPHAWEPMQWCALLLLQIAIATAFWYCCERPFLNPRAGGPAAVPYVEARGTLQP